MEEKIRIWLEQFKDKPAKEKLMIALPYAAGIFLTARIAELYRLCRGDFFAFIKNIQYIYKAFPPQFTARDLLIGVSIGFFIVYAVRWQSRIHRKNTRSGEEYGSAKWSA